MNRLAGIAMALLIGLAVTPSSARDRERKRVLQRQPGTPARLTNFFSGQSGIGGQIFASGGKASVGDHAVEISWRGRDAHLKAHRYRITALTGTVPALGPGGFFVPVEAGTYNVRVRGVEDGRQVSKRVRVSVSADPERNLTLLNFNAAPVSRAQVLASLRWVLAERYLPMMRGAGTVLGKIKVLSWTPTVVQRGDTAHQGATIVTQVTVTLPGGQKERAIARWEAITEPLARGPRRLSLIRSGFPVEVSYTQQP